MIFGRMPLSEISQSHHQTQMPTSSQYSKQERFMFKAIVKIISEINAIKEEEVCMKYILIMIHDFK